MIAYRYSLYKRHSKRLGKAVFYVRFRDPDSGRRMPGRSSGKTDRNEARIWSDKQLKDGKYSPRADVKFAQFADGWWIWDTCPYISRKHQLEQAFSKRTAEEHRRNLDNYILPYFRDYKLRKIDRHLVERFRNHLIRNGKGGGKKLSPSTINNIVSVLSVMLGEATRLEIIHRNPAKGIGTLSIRGGRKRGILSKAEADTLFDQKTIDTVWTVRIHYVLNLLSATTGLRLGECLGLQRRHIQTNHLKIEQAWSDKYGMQPPKYNSVRSVPIPPHLKDELLSLPAIGVVGDSDVLLFPGEELSKPMNRSTVAENFSKALDTIGIDGKQRETRYITFHSWRHFFNTNMRPVVSDSVVRAVTGHRTVEMTENYTHYGLEHFEEIRKAQEMMFTRKVKQI